METTIKPPLTQRMNLRAVMFVGIIVFLVGWPIYTFVSETVTHGIHYHGAYKEVDLKAMGFFQFNPKTGQLQDVPAVFRALDGQKVLLTGLVKPLLQSGPDITEFAVLYSESCQCGFSGPPQVQEKVFATAAPGARLHYDREGYYEVLGRLHVALKHEGDEVTEVYHLDAESIKALQ